ncbi:LOW QUALITY PROTEIN: ras-related protein Rab-31 [Aptenodytes patagonicus]|uniref:LOW QUALITY PROTEIN: ras-related protein Rab-31 n=1 Tax=Aptenodytes patagonicus TaxID=9234 RepID=UPI003FA093E8
MCSPVQDAVSHRLFFSQQQIFTQYPPRSQARSRAQRRRGLPRRADSPLQPRNDPARPGSLADGTRHPREPGDCGRAGGGEAGPGPGACDRRRRRQGAAPAGAVPRRGGAVRSGGGAPGDAERPGPGQMMAIRELKVCLLGDTGVGKSSIVCRFVQDHFDHNISPTIGASFMTKTVPCGNELHKFLIWDTAGQERFHSLAPMYYRGSAAAVIVYDITKQDSFHTLKKWVKELKEHGPENIVMAIAGNKCDLSDIREVPMKDAKEYAESIGAIVVETSAKNAVNIEELFQGISRQIPPLDPHENGNNGAIKLGKQTSQTGRRCC